MDVFGAFGLTVLEKTETLLDPSNGEDTEGGGATAATNTTSPATRHGSSGPGRRTHHSVQILGRSHHRRRRTHKNYHQPESSVGVHQDISPEARGRPKAPWKLKVRLPKAKAMEALLYGCMKWTPCRGRFQSLRRTYHRLLLGVVGSRYHVL